MPIRDGRESGAVCERLNQARACSCTVIQVEYDDFVAFRSRGNFKGPIQEASVRTRCVRPLPYRKHEWIEFTSKFRVQPTEELGSTDYHVAQEQCKDRGPAGSFMDIGRREVSILASLEAL